MNYDLINEPIPIHKTTEKMYLVSLGISSLRINWFLTWKLFEHQRAHSSTFSLST